MPLRIVESCRSLDTSFQRFCLHEISRFGCQAAGQTLALSLLFISHLAPASDLFVSGLYSESEVQSEQIPIYLPWSDEITGGEVSLSESPQHGQLLDDSGVVVNIDTVLLGQNLTYIPDPLFLGDDLFRLTIDGSVKTVNIYVFDDYRSPLAC